MKIPKTPPDHHKIMRNKIFPKAQKDPEITKSLFGFSPTDKKGRYLHWDKFRFQTPPEGLTAEEYWTLTRFARLTSSQKTPFEDKSKHPLTFVETDFVRELTHHIDSAARGALALQSPTPGKEYAQRYLIRSLIEEPFKSSVLEGAATTRDIAKKLVQENRRPRNKSERMVLNNYWAMKFIKEIVPEPLTPEIVKEIHLIITKDTLDDPKKAGALRNKRDNISVTDETTGEVLHAPPHADELPERLKLVCDFANKKIPENMFIHPIIRAIILHFMIGYDHPFVDGNGRTARALFYWSVIKENYWLLEYVSISRVINHAPVPYGLSFLYTETDYGDLTYFIIHQLKVIQDSINELNDYLNKKTEQLEKLKALIRQRGGGGKFNHRQVQLLNDAVRRPGMLFTIAEHQNLHQISYLTARKDLEDLASIGLLRKLKRGNRSIYIALENIVKKLQQN